MNGNSRFDSLLDRALETGQVPPEATGEERREIEELLVAAGTLRSTSAQVDAEAGAAAPTARARFERFLQDAGRTSPVPASPPRRSLFGRTISLPRGIALAGSAVAAGIVAVILLVVSQGALDNTETALAEVLQPGDYVQLDGVISEDSGDGDERVVTVLTEFGMVRLSFSSETAVVSGDAGPPPSRFRSGDTVTLSGNVANDRSVKAQTVAFMSQGGQPPERLRPRDLDRLATEVNGRVVALAVSRDGSEGRVLLDAGGGEFYVATVDSESVSRLITASTHAPGATVSLTSMPGAGPRVFSLTVNMEPPARPGMDGLRGVIVGKNADVLEIESPRGTFNAVITPGTRIILVHSGLDREAFMAPGGGIGHEVVIVGPVKGDTAVADVVAVGPLTTRR